MDQLDHNLLAELRINGRASVPQLATLLGVARGTVQKRLDRMIAEGIIKGFTVRLREVDRGTLIRAIVMIELGGRNIPAAISSIKKLPGFANLSNTNGAWDMVGEIEVGTMNELNILISTVRRMEGVLKTETHILLGPA
ncbi:Lrp/AsnC family transcriptional regulator [Xinfangfangia sp. CPCC 101601]|uniref:Lrp/AsnC family transcriptional regulator n=1 Tax=Pseudogemmobacter lacusdianii TaxID=3069608 RepID=A0ABU0W286_9RHOB|nr:Lrp/AsnC family transcriptional regulator [Xinfangfangia sp. CPCC 101601]MDQ2068133.1 Lrp/AsnC family transcriptional regulator [Xinfangfangia sp. CPCC 101601]